MRDYVIHFTPDYKISLFLRTNKNNKEDNMRSILLSIALMASISVFSQANWTAGASVGYSSSEYMPVGLHVKANNVYYGVNYSFLIGSKEKDNIYSTSDSKTIEGHYYNPLLFEFGYQIRNITIGAGLGYNFKTKYTESFPIGSNAEMSEKYFSGGELASKVFMHYNFNTSPFLKWFLGVHVYSHVGVGVCVGFDL